MTQDSTSILKNAAEAFNSGNHDTLKSLCDAPLAKGFTALASVAGSSKPQYEILHSQAEGPQVSFAYLVRQTVNGKPTHAYGTGVALVQNGKITSVQHQIGAFVGATPSLTGTWVGSSQGITVTLNLTQNPDNSVTGTANAFGSTFPVTGTVNYPNVNLQGSLNGVPVTFAGAYNPPPNTIPGTLTAMGGTLAVTLNRQ